MHLLGCFFLLAMKGEFQMAVNETIVINRKWRKCIDIVNKTWQRISFWTHSSDVEFEDGKTAEIKVGAIDGITDSLASDSSRIAASAKAISELNNDLTKVKVYVGSDKKLHFVNSAGADSVLNFSSTLVEQSFSKNITTGSYQIPKTITKNGVTYNYVGVKSLTLVSILNSGGSYTISVNNTGLVSINNPATSGTLNGVALYNI